MENISRNYNSVVDIVTVFNTREKLEDFFTYYLQSVKRFAKNNKDKHLPLVYSESKEIFSLSYDYFVSCIAKFYDPGNEYAEEKIKDDLQLKSSLGVTDSNYLSKLHKNREFVIVALFQDYFGVLFPNNPKINVSKLRGIITASRNYFIPIVYEDKKKKPIEYAMIPVKRSKLLELNIDENLLLEVIELSDKKGLKDVAFNARQVNSYWSESEYQTVIKYE